MSFVPNAVYGPGALVLRNGVWVPVVRTGLKTVFWRDDENDGKVTRTPLAKIEGWNIPEGVEVTPIVKNVEKVQDVMEDCPALVSNTDYSNENLYAVIGEKSYKVLKTSNKVVYVLDSETGKTRKIQKPSLIDTVISEDEGDE